MPQVIRFEYVGPVVITTPVLETIGRLAAENPNDDIRVTDDGANNVKVHVGTLNEEGYRYWVYTNGLVILKECDISADGEWEAVFDAPVPEEPTV